MSSQSTPPVKLRCKMCGAVLKARTRERAYQTKCPKCAAAIRVPATTAGASTAADEEIDAKVPTAAPPGEFDDSVFFLENLPPLDADSDSPAGASGDDAPASRGGGKAEEQPAPPDVKKNSAAAAAGSGRKKSAMPSASRAEESQRPAASQPAGADDLDDFGGGDFGKAAPPPPPVEEYRLRCEVCDSVMWVRASQAGTVIQCDDCFSELTVPPPPPKPPVRPARADDDDDDPLPPIVDAHLPTATAGTTVQSDSNFQQRTVQDYLREAEAADPEEDYRHMYDNPDLAGWFRGTAKMFFDAGVLAHVFMFGIVLTGYFWMVLSGEGAGALQIIASVLTLLLFVGMIVSGMAILIASANNHPYVSDWPLASPAEALGEMMVAVGSYTVAAIPGLILCSFVGFNLLGIAGLMLGIFVIWPIVLLSMLDNNTPFNPISLDVTRSIQRAPDAWGVFYTSSGVLFAILYFIFLFAGMLPLPVGAVLCGFGLTTIVFLYFRLMGQLAQQIGNAVNVSGVDSADEDQEG